MLAPPLREPADARRLLALPLIDLRSARARTHRRCLLGSFHLPSEHFQARSMELPPRRVAVALLVADARRGGRGAPTIDEAESGRELERSMRRWWPDEIAGTLTDFEDGDDGGDNEGASGDSGDPAAAAAAAAEAAAAAAERALSRAFWALAPRESVVLGDGCGPGEAALRASEPQLWRPSPMLEAIAGRLAAWLTPAETRLHVLDAGCGTGRNAVFLAERLGAVAHIVAVDNRREIVERLSSFAARRGIGGERLLTVAAEVGKFVADLADDLGGGDAGDAGDSQGSSSSSNGERGCVGTLGNDLNVALFMRFCHKAAISALAALVRKRGGSRPMLVVVEGFHVTATHPSARGQQFDEGEVAALLAVPGLRVDTLLEERGQAEDGRPLLLAVARIATGALRARER
jgi:SAM-dependent methyltransferase